MAATLKGHGITRPRDLDGRKYASYGARFEGRIVQKLIQSDGGKGQFDEFTPEMLGIWGTLITGKADATWIFKGWEGVEALLRKIELNEFSLSDFGIPYGYSPLVVCCPDTLKNKPKMVRDFLECTGKGFAYAASNIEHASEILLDAMTGSSESSSELKAVEPDFVSESMKYMAKFFVDDSGKWGFMKPSTWVNFVEWLSSQNLLTSWLQSRNPVPGVSASLDELRSGNGGSVLKASDLILEELFTNAFL
ncbi:hypothetical protein L7F22_001370 [Adiantum nelumboides]|nr:hypothetical protein [Adiantum nelumboides]